MLEYPVLISPLKLISLLATIVPAATFIVFVLMAYTDYLHDKHRWHPDWPFIPTWDMIWDRIDKEALWIAALVVTMAVLFIGSLIASDRDRKAVQKWEQDARWYLATHQEPIQGELKGLYIDLHAKQASKNPYGLVTVDVSFVDDGKLVQMANWDVIVLYDAPGQPYITVVKTLQDYGKKQEIKAGEYLNPVVHIPLNYPLQ